MTGNSRKPHFQAAIFIQESGSLTRISPLYTPAEAAPSWMMGWLVGSMGEVIWIICSGNGSPMTVSFQELVAKLVILDTSEGSQQNGGESKEGSQQKDGGSKEQFQAKHCCVE
nr:hypothetical protein Iba_chr13bCG13600 [Ipomoea batatas]GMD76792.1 hypothetical protein Iba_chr13bCG13610 [Ipomoea batatas]